MSTRLCVHASHIGFSGPWCYLSSMRNGRRTGRNQPDLFETSLATGITQALARRAAEYTHQLLESDPELRQRLRENWAFIFERIGQHMREPESPRRKTRR
jgi:hypothetical protein